MKKTFLLKSLLAMCFCYVALAAHSQSLLGFKAGINITSITTDEGYKKGGIENTIGLHAGVMWEKPFSDHFAIQPGLNFLQKGFANNNGTVTTDWIFNILDLHVLAKYKYNIGKVKAFIDAGPTVGPVLSGYKDPDNGDKITLDFDTDLIRKWDYGISAGLGFGLPLGSGDIYVDGRYMLSFSNIYEDSANKGKSQKVGFDYTLGYLFPLK